MFFEGISTELLSSGIDGRNGVPGLCDTGGSSCWGWEELLEGNIKQLGF